MTKKKLLAMIVAATLGAILAYLSLDSLGVEGILRAIGTGAVAGICAQAARGFVK